MALVFLSLGSNLNDRQANLETAILELSKRAGRLMSRSEILEYEAWGYDSNNNFLNMAIAMESILSPQELLDLIIDIESTMGRTNTKGGYSDRPIDIDIIFFDDLVFQSPDLTIPHPLMQNREFVLKPLSEIASEIVHPVLGQSVGRLLADLNQTNE